jgi:hypothetical protein
MFVTNILVAPMGPGEPAQNAFDARLAPNGFVANLQISQDGVRMFRDRDSVKVHGASDWSPGNYKGNCGPGEAMTGMSQASGTPLPGPHALRCKAYGAPFSDLLAAAQPVAYSSDSYRSGRSHASYDWDPGFAKNECGLGEYVSGVSQETGAHRLVHLRCAAAAIPAGACNSRSVMFDDRGENTGDWDPGHAKGECGPNMVVMGVSVDPAGKPRRLLCCPR